MHTFYQHHPSEHRWTKDHPLEQVIGNPSQSVRTIRQLESDSEMCMFALTVSRTEPKNIEEAGANSAWIESKQEELHQFDRLEEELHQFDQLDVWESVDIPLCKNVINMKWLWKKNMMKKILFDELPQMVSDHVSYDPVPQCQRTTLEHDSLSLGPQCLENVPHAAGTVTTSNELDLLFSLMFDELLNGST
nr:Gag-Pol polyprotein [Tanacetum cinerariifolium]